MAIIGLGMDVCAVARIKEILEGPRGERFLTRVFTEAERKICSGRADAASAYAARFAAKEALVKALGAPPGITWKDMEVTRESGAPQFVFTGVAQDEIERRRCRAFLALTHDAGVAAATVVLESES